MQIFKLQKYDPTSFDEHGRYSKDTWRHVSDIGRAFGGTTLTSAAYLALEDQFVSAISCLKQRAIGDRPLKVFGCGVWPRDTVDVSQRLFGMPMSAALKSYEGEWVTGAELEQFIRLCLRDLQGYAVSDEQTTFFEFTGEYYVHCGMENIPRACFEGLTGVFVKTLGTLGDATLDNEAYLRLLPGRVA